MLKTDEAVELIPRYWEAVVFGKLKKLLPA